MRGRRFFGVGGKLDRMYCEGLVKMQPGDSRYFIVIVGSIVVRLCGPVCWRVVKEMSSMLVKQGKENREDCQAQQWHLEGISYSECVCVRACVCVGGNINQMLKAVQEICLKCRPRKGGRYLLGFRCFRRSHVTVFP